LPWASGAYIPGDRVSDQSAFGAWRGAPTDVVVTWPARQSWEEMTDPHWMYDAWKDTPQTKVFGLPPFPENQGASLGSCASGAYDSQWRRFATNIKAAGLAEVSIIRLGWEFNGDWYEWKATDPSQFAACWRAIHDVVESIAPGLRWDWNVNRGTSAIGIDPRDAWPGDDYVDIVGIDSYDGYPPATDAEGWATHLDGPYGLNFWVDFAKTHRKLVSVPEWGVYPGTAWAGNNGGDNPYYISRMFAFFRSLGGRLAYEAYFNEPASYYAGALDLNPAAAAAYRVEIRKALGLGGRASPPAGTTSWAAGPADAPTTQPATAESAPAVDSRRRAVRSASIADDDAPVLSAFNQAGVAVSEPVALAGRDGVKIASTVSVRSPLSFAGLRLVVRDGSGATVDVGPATWCVSVEDSFQLTRFARLPVGPYTAHLSYTIDGLNWTSGPTASFDVF
jgi:hypothetical protein